MKRKWGQHFLASPDIARRIVEAAKISPEDIVVEIGPGHGELTGHYIERAAKTFLVEVDPHLAEKLTQRWKALGGRLAIINQDIREVDFTSLSLLKRPVVLGNLPYNVSKPILSWLINWGRFERAVLTLQKEVVDRLLAFPGDPAYSLFSVLFALRAKGEIILTLGPEHFRPRPKVTSVVMTMHPKTAPPGAGPALEKLLRAAFRARRQMMINSLTRNIPQVSKERLAEAMTASAIPLSARAQEVSGEKFLLLLANLAPSGGASAVI